MKIGNKEFDTAKHTYIMGILNVTPDSFSDGGKWNGYDAAMRHAEELLEGGTDILDIGGEATRPGHQQITSEEEITRTAPVIEAVKKNFDVPVSIDTYKSDVAEAALQAGADLVNDIWGFQYDEKMAGLVKKYDAACCLMHNKNEAVYKDFLKDMYAELQKCVDTAKAAGIEDDRIMLDPGVGFGKTYEMNLDVMKHLDLFNGLGYPMLLGTSRKSMIGLTLDLPVGLPLETVSVKIERCWNEAFIALGSNMGDKKKYIENAVEELKNEKLCRVMKVSKLIGTEPYGVTDQDEFLNGALKMETLLTPHELLELLHRIEQEAGRKRIRRWGPRTLDLDIIFYGDQIIEEDDLCIPHIDMQNREFVLGPMCEIAPHKRHPVLKETMTEMLVKLKGNN